MGSTIMFHGTLVAVVTPMLEDGTVDYDTFEQLLHWHLQEGTDGIVVLGTTGESPTIEMKEREKLINIAVSVLKGKTVCIVGTGANATSHTITLSRQAMELGADGILLVTPYYNKPTQQGLFEHFREVAKRVAMPQVLYNVPSRTACDLLPETVARLSQISNIVALKEATGKVERVKEILALDCQLDLLTGSDDNVVEFVRAGGKGVISVMANVVPKQFRKMCRLAIDGDYDGASKLSGQMGDLCEQLFAESNPIPVKWLLAQMNKIRTGMRLPLTQLSEQYHASLRAAAERAGIQL